MKENWEINKDGTAVEPNNSGPLPDLDLLLRRVTGDGSGFVSGDWEFDLGKVTRFAFRKGGSVADRGPSVSVQQDNSDSEMIVFKAEVNCPVSGYSMKKEVWEKFSTRDKRHVIDFLMKSVGYNLSLLEECVKPQEKD